MTTDTASLDSRRFVALSREEQVRRIQILATEGWGDYEIAAFTRLHVEIVRRALAHRADADGHG